MIPGSQTDLHDFDGLLQAAHEGDVFVLIKNQFVSHGGLLQFIKSQGSMAYNLFESLNCHEQVDIPGSAGCVVFQMPIKTDSLAGLRDCSNAALTEITTPVLPDDLVCLKPRDLKNIISAQHHTLRQFITSQKVASFEE